MQTARSWIAWGSLDLVLALAFAGTFAVASGGAVVAQGSGLGGAVGVSAVPPPSWVQPGARVTFYSAAAAVAQSRYQLIEDPAGPWQDPVTGKHYRSTEDTGAKVPGGAIDGLWMAPQLLAQLQTGSLGGLLVLRGDYPLNGTTYQAVSIVNPTPGAYSSQTFDTATGVLLASTTNTAGATSPVQLPGQGPTQGASQLTISRFVSIRQMTIPGIGSAAPAWVARTPGLPGTTGQASYDVATGVLLGQAIAVASSGVTVQLGLQQLP